ncbi:hypothetical protein BGX31_000278 [Mortierella sp. GBA43]|nr:hypothetical protein BGX31_000278 [Mortierella sp. GBA43]
MIRAPSRYARVIRVIAPFAALCGLGYLFLITFVSDQFIPAPSLEPSLIISDHVQSLKQVLAKGLRPAEDGERPSHEPELRMTPQGADQVSFKEPVQEGQLTLEKQSEDPDNLHALDTENEDGIGTFMIEDIHDPRRNMEPMLLEQQTNTTQGVGGVLVMLVHEDEIQEARETIRQVEDRFNRDRNYPWVILSPLPLTNRSQILVRHLSKGVMSFGAIPHEQWRLPTWIQAAKVRNGDYAKMRMGMNKTSLMTRHRWRYMSGFLAQHELLDPYEFFWRIDPGVEMFCDMEDDPMTMMKYSAQKFAWSVSSVVNDAGVPSAWSFIQKFKAIHPHLLPSDNDEAFLRRESGNTL